MSQDESRYALPAALAGLRLAFQNTTALLQHGLLSPAKRRECAEGLQDLHREMERLSVDSDPIPALAGVRELIDRLLADQAHEGD